MAQVKSELTGPLDVEVARRSWQQVVDRHPVLRTTFHLAGDDPLQVVHRSAELPFELLDWSTLDPAETAERIEEHLEEDRRLSFRLENAPLMRLLVLRHGENRHTLLWSFHQIQMDGWSLPLLLREFFAL